MQPLNPSKQVLVSVPKDAVYQGKAYPGSGQEVAQRTVIAFLKHTRQAEIASPALQDQGELLIAARNAGAGYLVIPTIIHWEPRATFWTGLPSQVDISLTVIDVDAGREVRSTVLEGRTSMQPQDIKDICSNILEVHATELYRALP
jgi:hypothetical protein